MRRILCDVDGVLIDFVSGICRKLGERGFARTPQEFRHWDLAASLTPEEMRETSAIMAEPGFCHSLEWYEGAREFLAELQRMGDVLVVTAPYDGSETWERERKARMASEIKRSRVLPIPGQFKHRVHGDILIEDHPGTAAEWAREHPNGLALLIDRPWNSTSANEWDFATNVYRVASYSQVMNLIGGMA